MALLGVSQVLGAFQDFLPCGLLMKAYHQGPWLFSLLPHPPAEIYCILGGYVGSCCHEDQVKFLQITFSSHSSIPLLLICLLDPVHYDVLSPHFSLPHFLHPIFSTVLFELFHLQCKPLHFLVHLFCPFLVSLDGLLILLRPAFLLIHPPLNFLEPVADQPVISCA